MYDDGKLISDTVTICESLNGYFSEIGTRIGEGIETTENEEFNLPKYNDNSIFLNPVEIFEKKIL